MKHILMIYPETPPTFWSFSYVMPVAGRKTSFPPLGLMTVAAMVPEGYSIRLVDMNAEELTDEEIRKADLVLVSAMIIQKDSFHEAVRRCSALGKPVAAGGPYPTSSTGELDGVDTIISGEAETVMTEFFSDYERGSLKKEYRGTPKTDITATPIPRFDLINPNDYYTLSLQYSRGCPFNCEFCDIIEMFGRKSRTKNTDQFLAEFTALYDAGYRGPLFIVDDNFIGNKKKVKEMLPEAARWQRERRYPFILFTEASINMADDDELMDMMEEAGFNMIFLGIETPVEESLSASGKSQNVGKTMLESVRKIQSRGIEVTAGFIVGFDTDPENVFDLQIDFIQRSGIAMAMVGLLTALPGTRLAGRLAKENRLIADTTGNNMYHPDVNYVPVMDREKLIDGYYRIMSHIYEPKHYFRRCITMLRNMPASRIYPGAVTPSIVLLSIRGLLFSLTRQLFSSYGIHYARFIMMVLAGMATKFPKAVRMAVTGHHFFMMTRDMVRVREVKESITDMNVRLRDFMEWMRNTGRRVSLGRGARLYIRTVTVITDRYRKVRSDSISALDETLRGLTETLNQYTDILSQTINEHFDITAYSKRKKIKFLKRLKKYRRYLETGIRKDIASLHRDAGRYLNRSIDHTLEVIVMNIRRLESYSSREQ